MLTFGEETGLSTYAVDPGDMRTPMHQDAFPGEDISDRPLPETVVPHLLALVDQRPPTRSLPGRRRAEARWHGMTSPPNARASGSSDPEESTAAVARRGPLAAPATTSACSSPDPVGIRHHVFRGPPRPLLEPGDLVVVNNSATVNGEIDAVRGRPSRSCCTSPADLDDGTWVVELRTAPDAADPCSTPDRARRSASASCR